MTTLAALPQPLVVIRVRTKYVQLLYKFYRSCHMFNAENRFHVRFLNMQIARQKYITIYRHVIQHYAGNKRALKTAA